MLTQNSVVQKIKWSYKNGNFESNYTNSYFFRSSAKTAAEFKLMIRWEFNLFIRLKQTKRKTIGIVKKIKEKFDSKINVFYTIQRKRNGKNRRSVSIETLSFNRARTDRCS